MYITLPMLGFMGTKYNTWNIAIFDLVSYSNLHDNYWLACDLKLEGMSFYVLWGDLRFY